MPRYFFNVHDGRCEIDTDGTELTGQDEAQLTAAQLAADILRDEAHRRKLGSTWHMEVLDEAGRLVCRVDVSISIPMTGG